MGGEGVSEIITLSYRGVWPMIKVLHWGSQANDNIEGQYTRYIMSRDPQNDCVIYGPSLPQTILVFEFQECVRKLAPAYSDIRQKWNSLGARFLAHQKYQHQIPFAQPVYVEIERRKYNSIGGTQISKPVFRH